MSEPGERPRLYGDEEVARILKRATEIQVPDGGPKRLRGSGLSLAELEEIAAEAGIPVASIRQAAVELDEGGAPPERSWFTGESPTVVFERVLPGEVDPHAFEDMLVAIQRETGMHGQGGLLGRTLSWQAETPNKARSLLVTVATRRGQTRIRVEERLHQLAGQLFGGMMGGVGGGLGIGVGVGVGVEVLGSALFAAAFPLGIVGLSYAAARAIFGFTVRRRRRELRRLMEALCEIVEDAKAHPPLAAPKNDGGS